MSYENIKDFGFDRRTADEVREIARKGGKASGEARRRKADFKRTLNMLLSVELNNALFLEGHSAKKLEKGQKVSESEQKFFNKHVSEIGDKIEAVTEKANSVIEQPKVTTVKNPYQGRTPVQTQKKTGTVEVKSDNVATAKKVIELTNGDKSAIKKAYQKIFDEAGGSKVSTVKDVTYKGEPYNVSVGKKVIGKVVSDKNLSAEKLAILDDLDNIIAEGKFVGSGEYIPHGTKKKLTERFDYFETDVNINGEPYVVSFDVEVFPNTNNYRTHQITKIDLKEAPNADVGPEPTARGTTTSLSKTNIPESQSPVNVAQSINLETAPKSGNIGQLETEIKNIDTQISELKKNGSNDTKIAELESQKATAEQNLSIETRAKAANNGLGFDEYVNIERELEEARKEYKELGYKANNTKNSEHYTQYMQRRVELADKIEDLCEAKGIDNVVQPSKKTAQHADDLIRATKGTYAEDVKTLINKSHKTRDDFYRLFVDTFHGFEQFARQFPKDVQDKIRPAINNMRNAKNKAGGWLSVKRVSADGKVTGDSLETVLGDMLKPKNATKYSEFQYYCANKHNINRYTNGKPVFGDAITASDSAAICKKLEDEYPG